MIECVKFDLGIPTVRWHPVGYSLIVEDPVNLDGAILALCERGYYVQNKRDSWLSLGDYAFMERAEYKSVRLCNTCNDRLRPTIQQLAEPCPTCGEWVSRRIANQEPERNYRDVYVYEGEEHPKDRYTLPIPTCIHVYTARTRAF